MKSAIINNSSIEPEKIKDLLGGEVVVFDYKKANEVPTTDFDLIILSGSSGFPIEYNKDILKGEIELIQTSEVPVLGICYGAELINVAFGGTLKDIGEECKEKDIIEVKALQDDPIFCGRESFQVYDAHRWVIDEAGEGVEILAKSAHGPEVIKHQTRSIYGFQFHPEKMLDETYGDELYRAFVNQIVKK